MSTLRGRPPRLLCLADGIIGLTIAHCSSVRSEGYDFRDRSFLNIAAHSSAPEICANYRTNLLFCQVLFPDSLLDAQVKRTFAPVIYLRMSRFTSERMSPL